MSKNTYRPKDYYFFFFNAHKLFAASYTEVTLDNRTVTVKCS